MHRNQRGIQLASDRSTGTLEERASIAARGKRRVWVLVAVAAFLVSALASFGTARGIASSARSKAQQDFAASSARIASTLQLEIEHEEDLIQDTAAVVTDYPHITNAAFQNFSRSAHVLARYPEVLSLGYAVIVPASGLRAFAAQAEQDPVGPLAQGGRFVVTPTGSRPFYCFAAAGTSRSTSTAEPAGFDYCSLPSTSRAAPESEDSGKPAYVPFAEGKAQLLAVYMPVYRSGSSLTTLGERRASFLGWIGTFVSPGVLLKRALAGYSSISVSFAYDAAGSLAKFSTGHIVAADSSIVTNLHNGWQVHTYTDLGSPTVFSCDSALAVLCSGLLFGISLSILLLVLSTSRARALRMVDQRTGELRHLALHDALTGLPNRALVADRAEQLLLRNRRTGTDATALYLDLDGFKSINDSLGHGPGDELLCAVADRLRSALGDVDTIGRLGGDEFVVLLDGSAFAVAPEVVAERVIETLRRPFAVSGVPHPIVITISIGIATGDRPSAEQLLREADVALYAAKASGKDRYAVFSVEMDAQVQRRTELELALRGALDAGALHLAYQPIYDTKTLAVLGAEALLRWDHPELGAITPDEFIPLLESSGQIVEVGRWVLVQACQQLAVWRNYAPRLRLAVNVSARQLDEDSILDDVRMAIVESGIDASALTLEVTETALMRNIEATAERLHQLKALGIEISIDDFGTGYSSLAYIQRFPVDCLKIDRSFVTAITNGPDRDLVHTLVLLAKDLGARTIAEGVESHCQLERLRAENVEEVQGYLLAQPCSSEAFETEIIDQFLESTATHDSSAQ